jgi:hypothetical protein
MHKGEPAICLSVFLLCCEVHAAVPSILPPPPPYALFFPAALFSSRSSALPNLLAMSSIIPNGNKKNGIYVPRPKTSWKLVGRGKVGGGEMMCWRQGRRVVQTEAE